MSSLNDGIIRDIVRRIVDTAQPEKVILFGSQARGDARRNSKGSNPLRESCTNLNQHQPNAVAYGHSSALHGVKLYLVVLGVQ